MSLTIQQTRDDLLSKLGIEDSSTASALALQDVVIAINGAMQMLQTAGQDFFTRQFKTITLLAGTTFYPISDVQAILGPVRWNDTKPLRELESRGEIDQFERIFMGGTAYGTGTPAEPEACFFEAVRNSSSAGEITQLNLFLAPIPTALAPGTLTMEVVNDAVSYDVEALSTSVILPVAQNYTETVFLPIARMLITRSHLFSRPDILEGLTNDYNTAMARLATVGGFPDAVQPGPERKTKG